MHDTALLHGNLFFEIYLKERSSARILDIGSTDVNGSLRQCAKRDWHYIGVDLEAGSGVDIVLQDPYSYPFEDQSFDAVVSTSCLEHDDMFWLSFLEMLRVVKPGGFIYLNVPSNGYYHTFPVDSWRFYPDAGLALERWGKHREHDVTLLESFIGDQKEDVWNDFVAVFWKGVESPPNIKGINEVLSGTLNTYTISQASTSNLSSSTHEMRRATNLESENERLAAYNKKLEHEIACLKKLV
ncbi:Methyltransferase domain family protein [marine gamma proteobacterium HTCC2148]|nr:Methyltransferase domain family protein [marine gamma proteobacterium HTCC2148]